MSVSGGSITETTISGLTPTITYSIEVAAVNSAGNGVYSSPISAETPSETLSRYTCHIHRIGFYVDLYCTLQVYFSV